MIPDPIGAHTRLTWKFLEVLTLIFGWHGAIALTYVVVGGGALFRLGAEASAVFVFVLVVPLCRQGNWKAGILALLSYLLAVLCMFVLSDPSPVILPDWYITTALSTNSAIGIPLALRFLRKPGTGTPKLSSRHLVS